MNDHERAICHRLRDLRDQLGWSQTQFAHAAGTKRDQLASIEYGRNPLRYWLADRVCEKLDICQQWLACGEEPIKGYVRLYPETGLEIKPNELFSAAWNRKVGHFVKKRVRESEAIKKIIATQPNAPEKIFENRLYYLTQIAAQHIPAEQYNNYFDRLMAETSAIIQSLKSDEMQQAGHSDERNFSKTALTNISNFGNNKTVKSRLPELLKRLNEATCERGTKTALAKFMDVPLPKISQWLSGTHEPGGETTLMLLHWVEEQERQK